ncbi:MAG: hypothetical protein AB7K52_10030 [Phycisphaerales bacterium]
MDTTILRLVLGGIAIIAAIYLIWPQIAVWLDRVKQPVCAHCRYPAGGIAGLTCPECGSDLRRVGILTPGMMMRRAPGPWTWIAAWTLAWALVGVGTGTLISEALDGRIRATKNAPFRAADDPGLAITFDLEIEGWREPPRDLWFSMRLTHASRAEAPGRIEFTWPEARVRSSVGGAHAALPVGGTVDAGALSRWLGTTDLPDAAFAGTELLDTIRRLADGPYNMVGGWKDGPAWRAGGSSLSVRHYTPGWVHAALAGLWLTGWLVGLGATLRIFRRGSRRPRAVPPAEVLAPAEGARPSTR